MNAEVRRAQAAFTLAGASSNVMESGSGEAVIGDDALTIGTLTVAHVDVDVLRGGDYRLDLELWPSGRLTLSHLGRRFDTFSAELRRVRNQSRVAGLLAHAIVMPEVFTGALLAGANALSAELQVYDTHVTIVPEDDDPWQIPLGAMRNVTTRDDPPSIVVETSEGATVLGKLGRQRDACHTAIVERRAQQQQLLADLTGHAGFSDGWGVRRSVLPAFDDLLDRFTSAERAECRRELLAATTGDPAMGFVRLLDPDGARLGGSAGLPESWATFLLVPVGSRTVLEILAGPAAATYVFVGDVDSINRDLQLLHFRRAPLALTAEQAEVTPTNPHRLALRRLEPLRRLRSATVARVVHNDGWLDGVRLEEGQT